MTILSTKSDETEITVLRTDPQKHGWDRLHSNYGCCNQITFFFLKIINYSNKLQKKEADFKTQIYIFFHRVKKHRRFWNCRVNIHEPLVPQPTRTKMNWCIFYRRPWHVHCCHGTERLWKGRDAQGMGVFDRGGGGCHSEGSIRDRSVGKELWQHPSERFL